MRLLNGRIKDDATYAYILAIDLTHICINITTYSIFTSTTPQIKTPTAGTTINIICLHILPIRM